MEALEEQNKKLTTELSQLKEQMAQMMELMRHHNIHDSHHSDHGSHHEGEEEEHEKDPPNAVPLGAGIIIKEPEVSKEQFHALEDRLRAMEGHDFDIKDAADMCLVRDIQFPPKFKVPDFPKYVGSTCPKSHLTMYCRKMAAYATNEKLLIHCFQESLAETALNWYMQLDGNLVHTWRQLADAFLKRYKYNIDLTPDRSDLQALSKKNDESFKAYAQRWRELAAQIEPPLSDKETVSLFINSLTGPYYDKMIGNTTTLFSDIITIGERVEQGLKSGKLAKPSQPYEAKKAFGKKKEGGVNAVTISPSSSTSKSGKSQYNSVKKFDKLPTTYSDLLPKLVEARLIAYIPPKKVNPPYPDWYNPQDKCLYHSGAPGHSTENCRALKYKVQDLIDAGWVTFDSTAPDVSKNPLPQQE